MATRELKVSIMINKAFTLIELIITIVLIGIVVIPSSMFLIESMKGAFKSKDVMVAASLARMELEQINNMHYNNISDQSYTPYSDYNYDLRRIVDEEGSAGELIKIIRVEVYPAGRLGNTQDLLTTVITHRAENVQYQ